MEEAGSPGLNQPWAAFLPPGSESAAASLRLQDGLEACRVHEGLWMRGPVLNETLEALLTRVAPSLLCRVLPDGQLIPAGRRVPAGYLPRGPWLPLQQILAVLPPTSVGPAAPPERVALMLARSTIVLEANALLTRLTDFAAYADAAPSFRLDCLAFAVDANGRVVVRGTPLPPIAGTPLVDTAGILVPCGWRWTPDLPAPVLRQILKLLEDELALVGEAASIEILRADQFVRAHRASVRQTVLGVR